MPNKEFDIAPLRGVLERYSDQDYNDMFEVQWTSLKPALNHALDYIEDKDVDNFKKDVYKAYGLTNASVIISEELIKIANELKQFEAGDANLCEYPNCGLPAEVKAYDPKKDHVGNYCVGHAKLLADKSEYTVHCPNCGCVFGVN